MTGFKNFVVRGNLVELAVAVVIGTQFSSLVKQFVSSFVDPLLSLVGGTPDLGKEFEMTSPPTPPLLTGHVLEISFPTFTPRITVHSVVRRVAKTRPPPAAVA
jgi:large conductance mechanosensitive channel protein